MYLHNFSDMKHTGWNSRLLHFFNLCWTRSVSQWDWNAVTFLLLKMDIERDKTVCSHYLEISLLNSGYKLYSKVIMKRLQRIVDTLVFKEHCEFRSDLSCIARIIFKMLSYLQTNLFYWGKLKTKCKCYYIRALLKQDSVTAGYSISVESKHISCHVGHAIVQFSETLTFSNISFQN